MPLVGLGFLPGFHMPAMNPTGAVYPEVGSG